MFRWFARDIDLAIVLAWIAIILILIIFIFHMMDSTRSIGTIEALHGFWEWVAQRASLGVN